MNPTNADGPVRIVEATIAELAGALDRGDVTSVELVAHCLNRIARYDRSGIRLNAVPVLNPDVFADAQAADDRRARRDRRRATRRDSVHREGQLSSRRAHRRCRVACLRAPRRQP